MQFDPRSYEQPLKDEFDRLYEEGFNRRRMMVVSCHDRIMGHANRVRVPAKRPQRSKSRPRACFNSWIAPRRDADRPSFFADQFELKQRTVSWGRWRTHDVVQAKPPSEAGSRWLEAVLGFRG